MANFMLKFIPLGVLVHVILFVGVMEIYFQSPIQHGLPHYKSLAKPPAKRVVVIIADGLRAESLYEKNFGDRMPFLKHVRYNRGSWGISHTRVPTESRPGHVSIMAGIYEDPSAIFKGWQHNPVDFDSVINQSANAWCFGSPDNVYLFNKGNLPHIRIHSYHSKIQDFGKKETFILDEWVFIEINKIFKFRTKKDCGDLCSNQNIFFLNLLGLDTAGHSYKPNSKEHIYNMKIVDTGIKNLETLFNNFYKDNKTAYIFTADHGMTDWGSHGDGSRFETETPIIAWGAGINNKTMEMDVDQADIAPLIAALIGINYPSNSLGVLPYKYLNISKGKIAEALFGNVKQLLELYKTEEEKASTVLFYKPYKNLKSLSVITNRLNHYLIAGRFDDVIYLCENLVKDIFDGLTYLQHYSSRPIYISLSLGMVYWVVYLGISMIQRDERFLRRYIYRPNRYHLLLKGIAILITFGFCLMFFRSPLTWTSYMYIAFPIVILLMIFNDIKLFVYVRNLVFFHSFGKKLIYAIITIILLEIFVLGFHYRAFFSFFMIIISFWPFTIEWVNRNTYKDKIKWTMNCLALAIFPVMPVMHTGFNFFSFFVTFLTWTCIMIYKFKLENIASQNQINRIIYTLLFRNQFVCYLVTSLNVLYIAICFLKERPVPYLCNVISWFILVASLTNMYISPTYILFRLVILSVSFMNLYTLFLFNFEGPFFICLLFLLYQWLQAEAFIARGNRANDILFRWKFDMPLIFSYTTGYSYANFRRAFFFIGFIFISFFGTGNIASLNSFDPMWVRNFITVFSPFTMTMLILIKITIPMLLVTCVFRAINIFADIPTSNIFSMVILFCDVMVFNFLFLIKNTGSWLEIGMSVSHFIIMEVTSVILMLFYFLSYVLTNFSLYRQYIRYMENYQL